MSSTVDLAWCEDRDRADPLSGFRDRFRLPPGMVYLDGNSLGALPAQTPARMAAVVEQQWGEGLVGSWTAALWMEAPQRIGAKIAQLLGARPSEVVVAESTTVCLHKLICAALALRPTRSVVLTEEENFHSDLYAAAAASAAMQATLRVVPRAQLAAALDDQVAALLLTHVDFRTGAMHDMAAMSHAAHQAGALAVWDLSHSVCAVPLALTRDGADMATGCGYKYLNGGPGAPAFLHVAEPLHAQLHNPLPGWLGHTDPFAFEPVFRAAPGMRGMITGTPHVLQLAALESAVDLWLEADLTMVRAKSIALTELFIRLVEQRCADAGFELATPADPRQRGSQVSLRHPQGYGIVRGLIERGVIADFRAPDICRFGFAPLYLRHVDVWEAVERLRGELNDRAHLDARYAVRSAIT